MTRGSRLAWGLVAISLIAGAVADRVPPRAIQAAGGYLVLAVDLHTHSAFWSDGALTPWGLVLEARRQGIDALAITGHDQVSDAKVGRWFSSLINGPTVLVGQEIVTPTHHLVAIGTEQVITDPDLAAEIEDIHRQGGLAIAAHPISKFWPAFDSVTAAIDGAEVCHPLAYGNPVVGRELNQFAARRTVAAIGSSDFHGFGRMGECRTFVFAAANTAAAILEAIRARRTVVYGADGRVFGDSALSELIASRPDLRAQATVDAPAGALDRISRICGLLGLIGLVWSRVQRRDL